MSTKINDFGNTVVIHNMIQPNLYEDDTVSQSVNFRSGDGPLHVVASGVYVSGDEPVSVVIEESNDSTSWTTVNVENLTPISSGFNGVQIGQAVRSKLFLRARLNIPGDTTIRLNVLLFQQKKTF